MPQSPKTYKKSPGSALITNRSPSQTPRGNRQIQTSSNRTNARKALRLAFSSQSEVIATLKGLKNTRTKRHKARHTTNRRRINHKATKSKTNTGTIALERRRANHREWGWGVRRGPKHPHSQPTPPWVSMPLFIQKYLKLRFAQRLPTQSMHQSEKIKIKIITIINKDEHSWPTLLLQPFPETNTESHTEE